MTCLLPPVFLNPPILRSPVGRILHVGPCVDGSCLLGKCLGAPPTLWRASDVISSQGSKIFHLCSFPVLFSHSLVDGHFPNVLHNVTVIVDKQVSAWAPALSSLQYVPRKRIAEFTAILHLIAILFPTGAGPFALQCTRAPISPHLCQNHIDCFCCARREAEHTCGALYARRSEVSVGELVLVIHEVHSRNQTQVVILGGKCP